MIWLLSQKRSQQMPIFDLDINNNLQPLSSTTSITTKHTSQCTSKLGSLYFTLPRIIHMESMEWGVDSRNFRWNPWNGGWTPYIFKMDSMEWGMDSMKWGMYSMDWMDWDIFRFSFPYNKASMAQLVRVLLRIAVVKGSIHRQCNFFFLIYIVKTL